VTSSTEVSNEPPPTLSVTVTNYNYAAFLPRAIDSILAQSFNDFELVIIDNASTDESLSVILAYDDPRIRLIAHDVNVGGLASFRESCDVSRGTYRVHVDADDWVLDTDAFRRQVEMLRSHPDMAFVYSSLTIFGGDGQKSWVSRPHQGDTVLRGEQALEDILGFNFGHSGLMFRLDLYRQTGGYPDGMPHIDDLVLAVRLAELGSVGYVDAELYAFNQHGANVHLSPQLSVVRDEVLPMIDAAFNGPLGRVLPDARAVRRRVERRALVHLPTIYIFSGQLRAGWRLYWQSLLARPWLTVAQPRTLSLVARSALGDRGFSALRRQITRVLGRRR
jgi:glycosyltransferase involved in cell wall biosynthesis